MADMKISITLDAKELMRQLGLTKEEIAKIDGKEIKIKADQAASGIAGLRTALAETTLAFAGVLKGVQMLSKAIQAVVKPTAEMEQLRLRLEAMYRDADKAKDAFDEFRKVAAKTPATLMQVAEAGAQLKAFGMEAEYTIEVAANLAAYMGTDIVDAANAMGRAFAGGAGSAEQLRRRGILELISSFTGIEDLTKLTLPEFRDVLIETLSDPAAGIAGTAETMAESYTGAVSNMQDAMYQLGAQIGNAFMPTLTQAALGIGNLVNSMLGLATEQQRATKAAAAQRSQFDLLAITYEELHNKIERTDEENKVYQSTINDILRLYPNYFKNIDLEKGKWDDIKKAISGAREELDGYLSLKVQQAVIADMEDDLKDITIQWTNAAERRREFIIQMQKDKAEMDTPYGEVGLGLFAPPTAETVAAGLIPTTYGDKLAELDAISNRIKNEINDKKNEIQKTVSLIRELYEYTPPHPGDPEDPGDGGSAKDKTNSEKDLAKYYEKVKFADKTYYDWKKKQIEDEVNAMASGGDVKKAVIEEQLRELDRLKRQYEGKDDSEYYEKIKFADKNYYDWKKKQIEEDVNAMQVGNDEKKALIDEQIKELDKQQKEYNSKYEKEYYEKIKFADKSYYDWKKKQIEDDVNAMNIGGDEKKALIDEQIKEMDKQQKEYNSKYETEYYEKIKFADKNYYDWKKKQIEEDVNAMKIGGDEKKALIAEQIKELDSEQKEYVRKYEAEYYEKVKFADKSYYEWKRKQIEEDVKALKLNKEQALALIHELLDELDKEQFEYKEAHKGSWFFSGLLGFDPDDPADQAKVQAIKDTFNTLFSQTTNVASGLLRLSIQRRDVEIAALEERAGKEGWENERLLAEKQKITKAYAEEERRYKRIQRALAITQATINVAEGVTKALSMGPIIGPILAGIITTMGAVQIGIIKAQKFAQGGLFRGKGGPRDDANLALLSDGEFVVNAASTKKYLPLLKQINEPGQPTLSSLDKGLLRTIAADYNMVRFFASPWVGVSQLRAAGKGYADGGLVGGGVSDAGLSGSAGGLVSGPAPDIERKVDTIIDKLDIINLNLVKKKLDVVIQGGSNPASIREMDASRLRMGERGYVPSA